MNIYQSLHSLSSTKIHLVLQLVHTKIYFNDRKNFTDRKKLKIKEKPLKTVAKTQIAGPIE